MTIVRAPCLCCQSAGTRRHGLFSLGRGVWGWGLAVEEAAKDFLAPPNA